MIRNGKEQNIPLCRALLSRMNGYVSCEFLIDEPEIVGFGNFCLRSRVYP